MSSNRERLLAIIREIALVKGEVTLYSGQKSDFYIDGKMIELSPEGAFLIGEVLLDKIQELQLDADAVGGLAVGAVPLVTSVAISCYRRNVPLEGFFVREAAKTHGTRKTIEGRLPDNARVVILDDVVTSGQSVLKAIEAVEERGATVAAIISIVDRNAGAADLFAREGHHYTSIFTKQDVLDHAHAE